MRIVQWAMDTSLDVSYFAIFYAAFIVSALCALAGILLSKRNPLRRAHVVATIATYALAMPALVLCVVLSPFILALAYRELYEIVYDDQTTRRRRDRIPVGGIIRRLVIERGAH